MKTSSIEFNAAINAVIHVGPEPSRPKQPRYSPPTMRRGLTPTAPYFKGKGLQS